MLTLSMLAVIKAQALQITQQYTDGGGYQWATSGWWATEKQVGPRWTSGNSNYEII